jgi:hypothetical protein
MWVDLHAPQHGKEVLRFSTDSLWQNLIVECHVGQAKNTDHPYLIRPCSHPPRLKLRPARAPQQGGVNCSRMPHPGGAALNGELGNAHSSHHVRSKYSPSSFSGRKMG